MTLLVVDFPKTIAEAQEIASRLIAERLQFAFSAHGGVLSISYPDTSRVIQRPTKPTPTSPTSPTSPEAA